VTPDWIKVDEICNVPIINEPLPSPNPDKRISILGVPLPFPWSYKHPPFFDVYSYSL
jgi:hypothetical protein